MTKKIYLKLLMSLLLTALSVPLAQAEEVTICNGTETNAFLPIGGFYLDLTCYNQVIYPESTLNLSSGDEITSITFYTNASFTLNTTFEFYIGETDATTISSSDVEANKNSMVKVYTGTLASQASNDGGYEITINFTTPYSYEGRNLLLGMYKTDGTEYTSSSFANYGVSAASGSSYYYCGGSYNGQASFLPKATINYNPGVPVDYKAKVSPSSLDFGKLLPNETLTKTIKIQNKGTQPISPTLTGISYPFSTNYTTTTINSGEELTINVTFNPTSDGEYSQTLTVNCGYDGGSFGVSLSGKCANEVTVSDGTATNSYLPVYGGYHSYTNQLNQMLYPSSELSNLSGKKLKSITFYPAEYASYYSTVSGINFYNGSVTFRLANMPSGTSAYTSATQLTPTDIVEVGTITMPSSAQTSLTEWTLVFDDNVEFEYNGGDLLIEVETVKGNNGTTYFYGETTSTNQSYYSNNYNNQVQKFLPKVTFAVEDAAGGSVTVNPNALTFGGETFYVGQTEDKTFTVTNTTEDAVTITMTGDNVFTFSPATVAAGATETITVTYAPTAAGTHTATLAVGGKTVSLTGTAAEAPVTTPTITTSVNAVSITTAPNTTGTATFTVTGANLEGDITLVASEGFNVTPATIASADAASGVTVTVAYPAPATLETKTGTITLTSDNAETKTVTITAESKEVVYEATVTPSSLNFGEVLVGQTSGALEIKVSNTGSETFTPAFSINNEMFTIDEPTAITGGTSIYYNVRFAPTATGIQTGVLTVTIGTQTFTVSLAGTGTELAAYDIASSAASGVHNFGDVFVDGIGTWNITLTNNGANAVTPVIEGLAAPFTAENVPATLAAGESATITIKFAPTEIQAYGPTSIVVKFDETQDFQFDYTLRGNGIENTGTLPPSAYDAITYTWTDAEGNEHPNTPLTEIATDPDQMIALMREVYTNKNLPGNFYRGYNANGEPEDEVAYPAIGKIVANYTSGVGYSYEYSDAYGWNIGNNAQQYPIKSYDEGTSSSSYHLKYFDPTEYKPNDEGLTLLLVEMRDNEVDDNGNITTEWTAQYSIDMETSSTTGYSYSDLRTMFGNLFKSVRVVPNSKRVTKNDVEGTLFKVDCDKMNRFFFLAKGRLRKADNSPRNPGEDWLANGSPNLRWRGSSASSPSYSEKVNREPFYQMFEQLSPVSLSNQVNTKDVYQALVNMESYNIEHDCQTIPFSTTSTNTGHEFCLYGKESISDDCQDVRDLMFFVPDLRMKYWSGRNDGNADVFVNYYEEYAPNIALYVIRQNEITGVQKTYEGNENNYELHLTWDSNLTDFVPKDDGVYYIYQVNDDGTYTKVGETNSQTKELYLNVAMQEHGQQVTYVIQGQDNTGFLSLQMSNEESFIIPGTDASEIFQLVPNVANYSRFDPQTVQNFYANGLQIKAYPGANASDYAGKTFKFYRKAGTETEWTLIGTAEVNNEGTSATVSMVETTQRQQSEYKFGYKANPATIAMSADAHSYKVFDLIYDNFKADVSANEHPSSYSYKMETADGVFHSNEMSVKVYKTQMRNLTGTFTEEYVENDEVRQDVDNSRQFDIDVEHSSKTDILRYGAYRWDSSYGDAQNPYAILNLNSSADEEEDVSPAGQASNQGEYYSVYMNGDSYIGDDVYVAQGETGQATFVDDVPANATNADEYTYAPVVETFTGRADYNTYGAPMQTTATGKIVVNVENAGKSKYTWEADGNTYRYYNVFVNVNTLDLPEGYEVAKVRAWRKIDSQYLGEKAGGGYEGRLQLDSNGEYKFDEKATTATNDKLGYTDQPVNGVYPGTFGAIDVESGVTIPMKFFVRVYFKKSANSGAKAAGDEYYITEVETPGELNNQIPTSIFGVQSYKVVTGIKYYNLAGIESDVPFQGVNIEVTTYTDGSRTTRKIMK